MPRFPLSMGTHGPMKNLTHRERNLFSTYLSDERIAEIIELSKKVDVVDRLAGAIGTLVISYLCICKSYLAPSIFGHHEIKKGILCLLFGGTRKSAIEGNR